jgi:chaperone required for assembly of F1-ATPase
MLAVAQLNLCAVMLRKGDAPSARGVALDALDVVWQNSMSGYFLCHLALLAASLSRLEEAAQMLGYVEAWFTANQYTREPSEERSLRLATEAVEARLEAAQIKALRRTGAGMNEAQARALTQETLGEAGQSEPSRSRSTRSKVSRI